ncbi:MAG TPA: hypothetical protein VKP14_02585 [Gaiellaceae bacterium]|nr:hypothetical protein [Gaiellaceae bacterium]
MRQFRWALFLLVGLVAIGVTASTVLARSHTTKASTYWNNAIPASGFGADGAWLGYGQAATFTFNDVSGLYGAMDGSVYLNFSGLSKSIRTGGGSGYTTTLRVTVTGMGTTTFTTTLANAWKPHVAYSNSPGFGWASYASAGLPGYVWKGATSLKVTVTPVTTNTLVSFETGGLVIGFITVG